MRCYYDFHIHSALSPCADDDMTPNNIIGMAKLKGLDAIAVADHNSILNVKPIMELGLKNDILVIPAMELETREEVHMLCLFIDYESAVKFCEYISSNRQLIENNKKIFGPQYIMDNFDNILGEEKNLLSVATSISCEEAINAIEKLNSAIIPAHIDRASYSVVSNLGFIPKNWNISTVEVSNLEKLSEFKNNNNYIDNYTIISNSDAHNLGIINEKRNFIEINSLKIAEIVNCLK